MSMIITNTTNSETKTHISEHRFGHVVFGTHVKLYLSMDKLGAQKGAIFEGLLF